METLGHGGKGMVLHPGTQLRRAEDDSSETATSPPTYSLELRAASLTQRPCNSLLTVEAHRSLYIWRKPRTSLSNEFSRFSPLPNRSLNNSMITKAKSGSGVELSVRISSATSLCALTLREHTTKIIVRDLIQDRRCVLSHLCLLG